MAELFGAVASGMGIAGVAAQAIDGIRKLQIFCNDVRDAPEEIKHMTSELEILLSTIAGIETQIQRNASLCQNLNPTPALRFVDQSVKSLNAVIQKLNTEIAQKRMLGSIKTAWKKKILEAHMAKIERSKTSLGLAVSAYSTELFLQTTMRTDTMIGQLGMHVSTLTTSCQARQMPASSPQTSNSQQIKCSQQLLIDDHYDQQRTRKRSKSSRLIPVLSFSLILPHWLAQSSLQISVCRAAQGWTLNLKPYRTVPHNPELSDVIKRGDFNKFRYLNDSNQATVFDRDEWGWTILHSVTALISHENLEASSCMARLLIERGANLNERTNQGVLAIYHLSAFDSCFSMESPGELWSMDFLRLLVGEMELDPESFWETYCQHVRIETSPRTEHELKRIFPLASREYPTLKIGVKLDYIIQTRRSCISPQNLAVYLDIESIETVFPKLDECLQGDLLRVLIMQWGLHTASVTSGEEWGELLRALIAAGAKLDTLCSRKAEENTGWPKHRNPGDEVVVEMIRQFIGPYTWASADFSKRVFEARDSLAGFRRLISRMEYLGSKLETVQSCKRHEISVDADFLWLHRTASVLEPYIEPHTLSLYYDDKLSTWVMWDSTYEGYCGEFWDLLEHPEHVMPGTWID